MQDWGAIAVGQAGGSSPARMPDMTGVGEQLHGLSESQSALYLLAVLIVALLIERGVTGFRNARASDRQTAKAAATAERLATSIDKLTDTIRNGDAQNMANMAVIQHELGEARQQRERIEGHLQERDR